MKYLHPLWKDRGRVGCFFLCVSACAETHGTPPSSAERAGEAARGPEISAPAREPAHPAPHAPLPAGEPAADAAPAMARPAADAGAAAQVEAASARPRSRVTYIGMHVGGGPNDAATKAPFERAIARSFDDLARCHEAAHARAGTFGVDLLIGKDGGHATVSNPRTAIGDEAFRKCALGVFENVVFERPRRGPTTISYSVRFDNGD